MAPDQTALALLVLFGIAALKVYGCVCYVGQEPVGATGTGYGWSLAEQRPCECTEFRLGGVNMKPQMKPFEVKIGEDNRVSINEQGQIVRSPDCRDDQQGTTLEGTSLCANNTYLVTDRLKLQKTMTSPLRLEFTVTNTNDRASVHFSPNYSPGSGWLYSLELAAKQGNFFKQDSSIQGGYTSVGWKGVKYIGVPVKITYDNGRFEVSVQGVPDSTLTYDATSPPQPSWFVSFETYEGEISFNEPCIKDFDPQQF